MFLFFGCDMAGALRVKLHWCAAVLWLWDCGRTSGDGQSYRGRGLYIRCWAGAKVRLRWHWRVRGSLHILARRVRGLRYHWQGIGRSSLVPFDGSLGVPFLNTDIPFRSEGLQLLKRAVFFSMDLVLEVWS